MKILRFFVFCSYGLILSVGNQAFGEDIDLYLSGADGTGSKPNVLFMIDNSANWNPEIKTEIGPMTKKEILHRSLYEVFNDPELLGSIRTGLMVFAKSNNPKGGTVRAAIKDLDDSHRLALNDILYTDGSGTLEDSEKLAKADNAPYALSFNEAYRYYNGMSTRAGHLDADRDGSAMIATVGGGYQYISPVSATDNPCGSNFIVLIANGEPDSGEDTPAENELLSFGGVKNSDPISLDPKDYASNWSDEYARFLSGYDLDATQGGHQNIITYVINILDPDSADNRKEKAAESFLRSIAKQGQGRYFTVSSVAEMTAALGEIIEEMQAINSVFAAVNLPVSVNVRGTHLNQVYMGMFRPDAQNRPRWFGNLKLYKLALQSGTDSLEMVDSNGDPVRSPTTGFINTSAQSYWSHSSSYWSFRDPLPGSPPSASDAPDGEVVEKGAVAQNLRERDLVKDSRRLYTCIGSCEGSVSLSSFEINNSAITWQTLGLADGTDRDNLIDWVGGKDIFDENSDARFTDIRSSVHGDVLHSRPALINYGPQADGEERVVAYYGANDGVFRAVEGGLSAGKGNELWGFIPQEFFGRLKDLYGNVSVSDSDSPKPYFADGKISSLVDRSESGGVSQAHLFLTMRRGGRLIYALDVTGDRDLLGEPSLLWSRSHNSTGYGELGQTWSEPSVARIKTGTDSGQMVLIFGAGYDPVADGQSPAATASMGRGVLVVDAATGTPIWQAGPDPSGAVHNLPVADMIHSIPSDVRVVDRNGDGYVDRAYVGDTGGNVWRIDMATFNPLVYLSPDQWSVHKLASVGGGSADHKFFFPPEVVFDHEKGYDGIYIGSGNREQPFNTADTNRFYMFKDRSYHDALAGSTTTETTLTVTDLYDATDNKVQVGTTEEKTVALSALDDASGWYVKLNPGEKVVSGTVVVAGGVFFSTHEPASADTLSCSSNLGIARTYVLNFRDASAVMNWSSTEDGDTGEVLTLEDRHTRLPGGGYAPSPVAVITEIDGQVRGAVIIGTLVMDQPLRSDDRWRTFWYKEME